MSSQASAPTWLRRLRGLPLPAKILGANLTIVTLGAVAGTIITAWHVQRFPDDWHYELIVLFAISGIALSFAINRWVLRYALSPLDSLQSAVNQVRRGDQQVRVVLGKVSDERFDRLAETFNQMIERLEQNAHEMQQLSRRIIRAQEDERRRLARDLHDEAAQSLTSLLVRLRLLERAHTPDEAQARVQELRELTASALEDVRRVALDLRPTILDDLGLGPAFEWRVDEFNRDGRTRAAFSSVGLDRRLPRDVELAIYRVGQEALSNVSRHARASAVEVSIRREGDAVVLEVGDDGVGFSPGTLHLDDGHGLGLMGMRERMATLGGTLTLESSPGAGTRVRASAPVLLPESS